MINFFCKANVFYQQKVMTSIMFIIAVWCSNHLVNHHETKLTQQKYLQPSSINNVPPKKLASSVQKQSNNEHLKVRLSYRSSQSIYTETSIVGNIEHPTIDGGVINSADDIDIYHETSVSQSTQSVSMSEKHFNNELQPADTNKAIPFNDSWVTSNRIKSVLERATQTGKLNFILKQSSSNNLPATIALLPIIESNYEDNAISSKGAAGSWQLMPKTAKEYGLNPEERSQFIPSTMVALNLLTQLHQKFGNWELAFAAYNAGSNRVEKALQQNPIAVSIDELDLPIETKKYVASLHFINDSLAMNTKS